MRFTLSLILIAVAASVVVLGKQKKTSHKELSTPATPDLSQLKDHNLKQVAAQTPPARSFAPILPQHQISSTLSEVRQLVGQGQRGSAILLLESFLEKNPHSEPALEELAMQKMQMGDLAKAEQWFKKTLDVNPKNAVALGELIHLFETSGRHEDAVQTVQNILARCGDCQDAELALGNLYLKSGDKDQAITQLHEASKSSSIREAALRQLYQAYVRDQDQENAKDVMREIIDLNQKYINELRAQGGDARVLEESLKADEMGLKTLSGT